MIERLITDSNDLIVEYLDTVDGDESQLEALVQRPIVSLLYEAAYHGVVALASLRAEQRRDVELVRRRFAKLGETSNVLGTNLELDANGDRASNDYAFFAIGADVEDPAHAVWLSEARVNIDSMLAAASSSLRLQIDQYFVVRDERDTSDARPLCITFDEVRRGAQLRLSVLTLLFYFCAVQRH